jgi:hypothetical protein
MGSAYSAPFVDSNVGGMKMGGGVKDALATLRTITPPATLEAARKAPGRQETKILSISRRRCIDARYS